MTPRARGLGRPADGFPPRVLTGLVAAALLILGASFAHVGRSAPAGALAVARSGAPAALLPDGSVLLEGGTPAAGANLASAERYSPATSAWTPAGSMATGRAAHTATPLPTDRVLVAGGFGGSPAQTILKSAELYDPGANAWSAAADMGSIREYHGATLLPKGKVLVTGGIGLTNGLKTTEIYDPAANAWAPAAPMATGRYRHTSTRLRDGRVLVVGGDDSANHPTATAEIYTPATNTWAAAASLAAGRVGHTATLLADGRVLVTGGDDSSGTPIAAAEVYDPVGNRWSAAGSLSNRAQRPHRHPPARWASPGRGRRGPVRRPLGRGGAVQPPDQRVEGRSEPRLRPNGARRDPPAGWPRADLGRSRPVRAAGELRAVPEGRADVRDSTPGHRVHQRRRALLPLRR